MRKQGIVVRWEAQRGFGFIRSPGTTGDVFFHKQDFRSTTLLREGLSVSFEEIHVGGKGPRAMVVQATPEQASAAGSGMRMPPATHDSGRPMHIQAAQRRGNSRRTSPARSAEASESVTLLPVLLMCAWIGALFWGTSTGRIPVMVWPISLLLNLATFFVYWVDKYAAQQRKWRTAEQTLHLFALLGGWPAAWVAQRLLRHKSSKASFRATYRFTVVLHCVGLAAWLFQQRLQDLLQNT